MILVLAEQRRGWRLMIFCARATRGLRIVWRERPGALLARRTRTIKKDGKDTHVGPVLPERAP
jgi:hypothetical protein